MDTIVVGFGFKARHGKDTVAKYVAEMIPGARIMPLALHLKAFARVIGMREKDGKLLQALGTEVFRRIDPHVWIDCLNAWIDEEQPRVALVPDVRFENEARWVASRCGLLVRVDRQNEDGTPYVSGDRDPNHQSERELEGRALFDLYFTVKSGDLDGLRQAAAEVAACILKRLNPPPGPAVARIPNPTRAKIIYLADRRFDCATGGVDVPEGCTHVVDPCGRPDCETFSIYGDPNSAWKGGNHR